MNIEQWLGDNNTLGIDIWEKKYQHNGETFDEWIDRISGGNEEAKKLIKTKKILFAGRILSNRGIPMDEEKTSMSNCYVCEPPKDNLESIYDTCKKLARTYSYGGGSGIDISNLAPEGSKVRNQAKTSSGAVSFMDTFAQVTEQVCQHGRRGALMISMRCDHPDIEKFITIKSDLNKVNFANISVMVTDDFMNAVETDSDWALSFTRNETGEEIKKIVKAKDLFDLLCQQNWDYAEPGILYWSTIEKYNLLNTNKEFKYAGTNPCAEEVLPANGSCLLGSINLSEFVDKGGRFNFKEFTKAVDISIRALNVILDEGLPRHPLKEQQETVRDWRQIGLGIFGLADALIKMRLTYGEPEAVEVCDLIGSYMAAQAMITSNDLAREFGKYPRYTNEVMKSSFYLAHRDFILSIDKDFEKKLKKYGLRNSQLLTIAPTGTLSTMIGVSGGIEPIFANSYTRTTQSVHGIDVTYKVYTPIVEAYMEANNISSEDSLPSWFVTSADISVDKRINMQAVWQKHIDASISSTVNLPESATVEDVKDVYMNAWKSGLKGVTVFRSGCARTAILNTDKPKEKEFDDFSNLVGKEKHLMTGCGTLHICAFFDKDGNFRNTYLSKGSSGGCNNYMIALSRMISLAARNNVPLDRIVDQLESSGTCPSYAVRKATKEDVSPGSSCPVAIGKALKEMYEEFNRCASDEKCDFTDTCPECGAELSREMGCVTCKNCGYSKCG